jgi:hypothetical protein
MIPNAFSIARLALESLDKLRAVFILKEIMSLTFEN